MEVHLPCPPLREWLPVLLANKRVLAWEPGRAPRRVRSVLREWPQMNAEEPDEGAGPLGEGPVDALLFGVSLERPSPPEACLAALPPGALIVELAVPRRRVLRELLGLGRRAPRRAAAAQARTLQWLARGYFALEQWQTVEPPQVVVTLARVR